MSRRALLTEAELFDALKDYVSKDCEGHQANAAQALGITPSYLNDVLQGRKGIGPKLLDGMRYRAVIGYQKIA